MGHYAFLDDNNVVTEVITGKDENEDDIDWELHYGNFRGQKCRRTSYNMRAGIHYLSGTNIPNPDQSKAFRKNYAGIGYTYDSTRDAFMPPKPYASWFLNEFSCIWEAPAPYPTDGNIYTWTEQTQSWDKIK